MTTPATLRGVSALRAYFRTNQRPIYFVSPTAFNLLGINRWVRGFRYLCYYDSFEGGHPNIFVPATAGRPSSSRSRTSATTCSATPKCAA